MKLLNQGIHFTKNILSLTVIAALPNLAFATSPDLSEAHFRRIATYLVCENTNCDRNSIKETVAKIVATSKDSNILIYIDSSTGKIGFVDIREPENPVGLGTLDTAGEPTSVAVSGDYALVAVNISTSFVEPSGVLAVYYLPTCLKNISSCSPMREIDMGGQPDSVAVSPNSRYAAVIVENERDEEVVVGGVEGGLPHLPAGYLNIIDIFGEPWNWKVRMVDLTGLATYGSDDPEPEFVSINHNNIAAVTMQENNYIAFVNLVNTRYWEIYTPTLDVDASVDEGEWKFFYYPLNDVESPAGGWVGLFEIIALGGGKFAVIERDNQAGPAARIKRIYIVNIAGIMPKTQAEGNLPVLIKTLALDVLPVMQAGKGWVHDKLEGLARASDGTVYVVTDNDGVDNSTGETQFLNLGNVLN